MLLCSNPLISAGTTGLGVHGGDCMSQEGSADRLDGGRSCVMRQAKIEWETSAAWVA